MPIDAIKAKFDERFNHWGITLDPERLNARLPGTIQERGWTIRYRFGLEAGVEFLEYFASHRMTNDTLNRIYADGRMELVGFCQEFYLVDDPDAERQYIEHNRKFYEAVEKAGLGGGKG